TSGFGQADVPNFDQTSFLQHVSEKRHDFGASIGGPLIHNRLFVFGNYRGIRRSSGATVLLTVPTQTVHDSCTGNANAPDRCDLTEYFMNGQGAACTAPCSNGFILNSVVSPEMVKFLAMIPAPNVPDAGVTNNFMASGVDHLRNDNFTIRADSVLSDR